MCNKKQENNYIYEEYIHYIDKEENVERITYIKERLLNQIKWYDDSSQKKQKKYKAMVGTSIILTTLIPVFSIYTGFSYGVVISTIIALFSAAATAITAIVNLCEYQKLWINYRNNCEVLKSLLHKYFTKSAEFDVMDEDLRFKILVDKAEMYMTKEHQNWAEMPHAAPKKMSN